MHKARWFTLLTVILCCSACGAPSLRHKKDINHLLAAGEYTTAAQRIERAKNKEYSRRDRVLYYLDVGAILHDAQQPQQSDPYFSQAQERIEELFTKSVSAHAARYVLNDLTAPYVPAPYERSLTYYYRAMNFLSQGDIGGALVEANRAVYYLDKLRDSKKAGWRDDPFVQYFMSLVFESAGKRDDARIARTRANQAYAALGGNGGVPPEILFSQPIEGWGEVILIHANGTIPLKKSKTFQVAWGDVFLWMESASEGDANVSPEVRNAISAGILGNAITVAYPVLEEQPFQIKSSEVVTSQGRVYPTRLMGDIAGAAQSDLQENEAATLFRLAVRAAAKRVAAVQARNAATQAAKDDTVGQLAEMFVSFLGALTEKADTRQWFTLPAQMRMTRFYVPPGKQEIVLRFRNGFGKIIGEHTFTDIVVPAGGRIYLHYRTAQ